MIQKELDKILIPYMRESERIAIAQAITKLFLESLPDIEVICICEGQHCYEKDMTRAETYKYLSKAITDQITQRWRFKK